MTDRANYTAAQWRVWHNTHSYVSLHATIPAEDGDRYRCATYAEATLMADEAAAALIADPDIAEIYVEASATEQRTGTNPHIAGLQAVFDAGVQHTRDVDPLLPVVAEADLDVCNIPADDQRHFEGPRGAMITHKPTGIVSESKRPDWSNLQNRVEALLQLRWLLHVHQIRKERAHA